MFLYRYEQKRYSVNEVNKCDLLIFVSVTLPGLSLDKRSWLFC